MARGVNKVILVGTLGRDPETQVTAGGHHITKFSIVTNEVWIDKQTNEKRERAEWHRLVTFGRLAEVAESFLTKGTLCYFEGKLQTQQYEKDGVNCSTTQIIVDEMQVLKDGKGRVFHPERSASNNAQPAAQYTNKTNAYKAINEAPYLDDVPF